MNLWKKYIPFALSVLATMVLVSGCGPGEKSQPDRPLDVVFGDCSASFHDYSDAFIPEMIQIAENSAEAQPRREFWAGCFDGAPLRTLVWDPKVDFSDEPSELKDNKALGDRVAMARALGLREPLEKMLDTTPSAAGSGQLEALELAAQTPGVGRVFVFTDAVINQIEGVKLATATPAEIQRTVKLWAPRLKGLNGVDLTFIGVGRGARRSVVVRNAQLLYTDLAEAIGTASFEWSLSLPEGFGNAG